MFISCKCGIETKSFYELEDKKKLAKVCQIFFFVFTQNGEQKVVY